MRITLLAGVLALLATACAGPQQGHRQQGLEPAFAQIPAATSVAREPALVPSSPAPAPVSVALVDIGNGTFCPIDVAKGRTNQWGSVGRHPYTGSPAAAIATFSEVPEAVRDGWLRQVQADWGVHGVMELGDAVCSMLYTVKGKHRRWDKVQAAWRDNDPQTGQPRTQLTLLKFVVPYANFDWVLIVPPVVDGGCDNWSYSVVARGAGEASFRQASAPPVRPQARSTPQPQKPAVAIPPARAPKKLEGRPKCPDNLPAGVLPGRCE